MTVATKQLYAAELNAGTNADPAYTCPADETTIVKSVAVYSNAGPTAFSVAMRPGGAGGPFCGFVQSNLSSGTALYFERWVVMQPGDTLVVTTTGPSGQVRVVISGSQLEGVAD